MSSSQTREEPFQGGSLPVASSRAAQRFCSPYPVPESPLRELRAWLRPHPKVLYPHRGFMEATRPFRVCTSLWHAMSLYSISKCTCCLEPWQVFNQWITFDAPETSCGVSGTIGSLSHLGGIAVLGGTSAQSGCPHVSQFPDFLRWAALGLQVPHDSVALLALCCSHWGFPHIVCLQQTDLIPAKLPIHTFPPSLSMHSPTRGISGPAFQKGPVYLLTFGMGPAP